MKAEDGWIEDHGELVVFARLLHAIGAVLTAGEMIDFFDSPWDWTPERTRWLALGRPEMVDVDVLQDAEQFTEAMAIANVNKVLVRLGETPERTTDSETVTGPGSNSQ